MISNQIDKRTWNSNECWSYNEQNKKHGAVIIQNWKFEGIQLMFYHSLIDEVATTYFLFDDWYYDTFRSQARLSWGGDARYCGYFDTEFCIGLATHWNTSNPPRPKQMEKVGNDNGWRWHIATKFVDLEKYIKAGKNIIIRGPNQQERAKYAKQIYNKYPRVEHFYGCHNLLYNAEGNHGFPSQLATDIILYIQERIDRLKNMAYAVCHWTNTNYILPNMNSVDDTTFQEYYNPEYKQKMLEDGYKFDCNYWEQDTPAPQMPQQEKKNDDDDNDESMNDKSTNDNHNKQNRHDPHCRNPEKTELDQTADENDDDDNDTPMHNNNKVWSLSVYIIYVYIMIFIQYNYITE